MVEEKLHLCQLHTWWKDIRNYEDVIHSTYSKLLPFPKKWTIPKQLKNDALEKLKLFGFDENMYVYQTAIDIYRTLSMKLGDKPFFFGEKPTSFDAVAFAYLASQYYAPFQQSILRYLISQHVNLKEYLARVLKTYYGVQFEGLSETPNKTWVFKRRTLKKEPKKVETEDNGKTNFQILALGIGVLGAFFVTQNKQAQQFINRNLFQKDDELDIHPIEFYLEDDEDDLVQDYLEKDLFFNKRKEPYVGDDGGAYDWNEGYLEEMRTGEIPDETFEFDSDDDE